MEQFKASVAAAETETLEPDSLTKMTEAASPSELIAANQGLVHSLAWRIHKKLPQHVELDDLVSYGQVGLAEAARDFDAKRGVQFTTFAYHRIRGAILDGLSEMNWFKRSYYYRGQYERLANEVLHLQGIDRSADTSSALEEDSRWFRDTTSALAMVYLFSHQKSDGESGDLEVEDTGVDSPQAKVMDEEIKDKLSELIGELADEGASLIRGVYFEGLSLKEAGERLGISKAWASRLHARTLGQLARSLRRAQVAE